MATETNHIPFQLQPVGRRQLVGAFDAGAVSTDGGLLLLHEVARRTGLLQRFAACFVDHRKPRLIEHSVFELVAQRVLALACGYEDLNDHAALRADPLLAAASGKLDPSGEHREHLRDRGKPLASPSTLNRLELTPADADASARYKKIVYKPDAIESLLVDEFLRAHPEPLEEIILDLDATDDPIHGKQEGRFFHGFYDCYCYLPLYIFCGDSLLSSKLRRSNIDASAGALEEIQRIVAHIRSRWPSVRITLRADSSFARDTIMTWCEATGIDYFFGLARNSRLEKMVEDLVARARPIHASSSPLSPRIGSMPARHTKTSTALEATWRIESRNSSSRSSRIEPALTPCEPTNSAFGSLPSPTC